MTTPTLVAVIALGVTAIAGVVLVVRGSTAGVAETGRAIGALLVAIIRALTDHAS